MTESVFTAHSYYGRTIVTPSVDGTRIPDSKLARAITELVREIESPLFFHHSSRVYYWGAMTGKQRGLEFNAELPGLLRRLRMINPDLERFMTQRAQSQTIELPGSHAK
jgi:hypothetical protein